MKRILDVRESHREERTSHAPESVLIKTAADGDLNKRWRVLLALGAVMSPLSAGESSNSSFDLEIYQNRGKIVTAFKKQKVAITADYFNRLLDKMVYLRKDGIVQKDDDLVRVILGFKPEAHHIEYFKKIKGVEHVSLAGGSYGPKALNFFVPRLDFKAFKAELEERARFEI